ncbi:coiled-coil domain-containing 77 [Brachionus plicatilis]|uniref:Coiled-coil domain-containing 77 n=1 Tax=Brachionus plicatilis TaxID=10195 RepID=A0A3M7PLX8_BRAPC|nr:coiled-coil domain-containing 77 [Brachionus plicatilis]
MSKKSELSKGNLNIPTVNERLGYLRPSRELLEYYRKKIGEYDVEREEIFKRLDSLKGTMDDQHKLQWELRQKDDEIAELQKAISDMQVFLFKEREQVLKLYAENDRLKIQELQDRKKINRLLSLAGVNENEVTYFVKEPPNKIIIAQKHKSEKSKINFEQTKNDQSSDSFSTNNKYPRDYESLLLQINALETQIQEQTKLNKEQIDTLLEDRKTRMEEYETQRVKDSDIIKQLKEKLLQTQNLLHESTRDFLDSKYEMKQVERKWMTEKDKLLQELDKSVKHEMVKEDEILFVAQEQCTALAEEEKKRFEAEIESLNEQLKQSHQLSEMYREQVIKFEDELSRLREQGDMTKDVYKDKQDKMSKRLQIMNDRYKELEKRRNMETEGFKNDIKLLRQKIKAVEKQLFKVTIGYSACDEVDVLKNVHETTVRSREMQGELNHLKAKIYSIENDIRNF